MARGDYGDPLKVKTADEMGQLITSFNKMVVGLKERDFIGNTFGRYVDQEIAKELLSRPEAIRDLKRSRFPFKSIGQPWCGHFIIPN